LGKATGFKGEFFRLPWGKNWGQKRGQKKLGKKGQKREQPFFWFFFWAAAKKTEKLRQKKIALPQPQIAELPPLAAPNSLLSVMSNNYSMKLCIIIHSPLHLDERGAEYIIRRLREGAVVAYFGASPPDCEQFKRALVKRNVPLNNVRVLSPAAGLMFSRFEAYEAGFSRLLDLLKAQKSKKIEVEFSGGAAEICLKNISEGAMGALVKRFGERRIVAHTFLPQVVGGKIDYRKRYHGQKKEKMPKPRERRWRK
jgi:hypothetical protein